MRIAYLLTDRGVPVLGNKGASVHARSITSALAGLGHDVHFLATNLNGENEMDKRISYHFIGESEKAENRWKWLKEAIKPANRERFRSTLSGGQETGNYEKLRTGEITTLEVVGKCAEEGRKILKRHPFDLILERLSPFGAAGMIVSQELGLPRIVEMNAPLSEESILWRNLQLPELSKSIEYSTLATANGIVVVSDELKGKLLKMSIEEEKILVLPNGVDPELFAPGRKDKTLTTSLGIDGKFVIGFSGSLKKWHGVDILIRALPHLLSKGLDAALLIIGKGPELSRLKSFASDLNVSERVVFTGRVPYNRMPSHLRLLDIAVAPYRTNGTFYFSPLKVIEYFACEIPVVATRKGELSRIITDGQTGLLIPENDCGALFRAISKLYCNVSLRKSMAKKGQRLIKGRTWADNARKVTEFAGKIFSGDGDENKK